MRNPAKINWRRGIYVIVCYNVIDKKENECQEDLSSVRSEERKPLYNSPRKQLRVNAINKSGFCPGIFHGDLHSDL